MDECDGFGREVLLLFEHARGGVDARDGLVELVGLFEQSLVPRGDEVGVAFPVGLEAFARAANFFFEVVFHLIFPFLPIVFALCAFPARCALRFVSSSIRFGFMPRFLLKTCSLL